MQSEIAFDEASRHGGVGPQICELSDDIVFGEG